MTRRPRVDTVIKVGGSVLRDADDYQRVADQLRPWTGQGSWIVVSAAYGVTNELDRLASRRCVETVAGLVARHTQLAGEPIPPDLVSELSSAVRPASDSSAVILSWGERASAAALRARMSRSGVHLPIAELPGRGLPPSRNAAIVPGFYVRDARGRVELLPRGGSDISAVLLATRLRAREVRFWKDGGGIRNPRDTTTTLAEADGYELLARLEDSIRPLHPAALRLALRAGLELVLEDPLGRYAATRIRSRDPDAGRREPLVTGPEVYAASTAPILP